MVVTSESNTDIILTSKEVARLFVKYADEFEEMMNERCDSLPTYYLKVEDATVRLGFSEIDCMDHICPKKKEDVIGYLLELCFNEELCAELEDEEELSDLVDEWGDIARFASSLYHKEESLTQSLTAVSWETTNQDFEESAGRKMVFTFDSEQGERYFEQEIEPDESGFEADEDLLDEYDEEDVESEDE